MSADESLTAERLRELMRYDPETGIFTNRVTRGSRAQKGAVAGSPDSDGYLQIRIAGKNRKAHRLAVLYMTGRWPDELVDHWDGCTANNRWKNIRCATPAVNSQNMRRARSDSKTKLLGASFDAKRNKYLAQILIGGVKKNLGRFETAELAHAAYLDAKRKHHEGNTL